MTLLPAFATITLLAAVGVALMVLAARRWARLPE
jgi:hypothetical protein